MGWNHQLAIMIPTMEFEVSDGVGSPSPMQVGRFVSKIVNKKCGKKKQRQNTIFVAV